MFLKKSHCKPLYPWMFLDILNIALDLHKFLKIPKKPQNILNIQSNLEQKRKVSDIRFSNFNLYYKAVIINKVWYWYKNRHINQLKITENPEINPHIHSQLISNKGARVHHRERVVSSINGVGETGLPRAKRMKLDL